MFVVLALFLGFPASSSAFAQDCPEFESRLVNPVAQVVDLEGPLLVIGRDSILQVVDLSTQASPAVLGNLDLLEEIVDLDISNGRVVVAVGEAGIRIVDISNPSLPIESGSLGVPGNARAVAAWGSLAVVAAEDGGIRIIDFSSPGGPLEVGSFEPEGQVYDVAVSNGLAYIAALRVGLRILDLSSPSNPTEVGVLESWEHYPVAVSGDFVYTTSSLGGWQSMFRIIDVSSPSAPFVIGELEIGVSVREIEVHGGLAFLAAHRHGLLIIDVSSPSSPAKAGFLETPDIALDLAVAGNLVYIADYYGGLRVIDASFPFFPYEVGAPSSPIYASKVAISDDIAYVAAGALGLHIVDISTLSSPMETSRDPSWASTVAVSGQLLFVGTSGGLRIYDISIPEGPVEIADTYPTDGIWSTCGGGVGLAVEGDLAFALCDHRGLDLWDVSDPSSPVHLSNFDTATYPQAVAAEGDFAYVLDDYSLLRVIDVATPEAPEQVGLFWMQSASDIDVSNSFVYAACGSEGLRIIDVSTPSEPTEIRRVETSASVTRVALRGGVAVVAGGRNSSTYGSLGLIDISPPSDATEICSVEIIGNPLDLAVSDGRIFLAQGHQGLNAFRSRRHIYQYWLDTAANQSGLFGSRWKTDVVARNTGVADADVEIKLHSSDGVIALSNSVSPGNQGVFTDVVGMMGFEGKGCLEVRSSEPLQVSGRTYNRAEDGTFGQFVEGQRSSDGLKAGESCTLLQLRQKEGEFRTNISITNTGLEEAAIRILLYLESGESLMQYTLGVAPESLLQDPEPFKRRAGLPDLGWGFAEVQVVTGEGILVSASVVDSNTNDATTIPAKRSTFWYSR